VEAVLTLIEKTAYLKSSSMLAAMPIEALAQLAARAREIHLEEGDFAFREGEEVSAGDVLFQIDPRPFQAALDRVRAVLERDRAQAETARLEMARAEALAGQGLIAAEELEQKRTVASALLASVRADSAALVSARIDLDNATIRAPISGRTGSTSVHAGDAVKANESASPIVTINQIRPINARFTLPQTDLAPLRRQGGKELRVDAAPAGSDSWSGQPVIRRVWARVSPLSPWSCRRCG